MIDLLAGLRAYMPAARRATALGKEAQRASDAGDHEAAERLLERAMASCPADADLRVRHALCATHRGRALEALPRWGGVLALAPNLPLAWCGIAASYRSIGALVLAEDAVDVALKRFPDDVAILSEAARLATARFRHEEALTLWTKALAKVPAQPDWLFGRADALRALGRMDEAEVALDALRAVANDHIGARSLTRALWRHRATTEGCSLPEGATPIAPADLTMRFESLGDNCEFGLVQRYCFAEPLGLFRFSFAHLDKLVALLERDFAVYGEPADCELVVEPNETSYDCRSRHYASFRYHTDAQTHEIGHDALLAREAKKITYLIRRLREDFAAAEKIFVRKGDRIEEAGPLFRALRRHGPVTLLWVTEADDDHPPGSVMRIADGLLHGRVDRFAPYGNAHDIDMATWLALLRATIALATGERLACAPNDHLAAGRNWAMTGKAEATLVEEPFFPTVRTQRLRLREATIRDDCLVAIRLLDIGLQPLGLITISLWVWIPDDFAGTVVDLYFTNSGTGFVGRADLRRRNAWQRVFSSTRLPRAQTQTAIGLRILGKPGDTIFIGSWRLETGCIPNRWSLPIPTDPDQPPPATIVMGASVGTKV